MKTSSQARAGPVAAVGWDLGLQCQGDSAGLGAGRWGVGGGLGWASSEIAGCFRLGSSDHSFRCLSHILIVSSDLWWAVNL